MANKQLNIRHLSDSSKVNASMKHGLYQKLDLDCIDRRTRLGKAITQIEHSLRKYVGEGSAISEMLISQITYKFLRLHIYQVANIESPPETEAQHYLPMSNSLRLDLNELTKLAGEQKPPDLDEFLASIKTVKT